MEAKVIHIKIDRERNIIYINGNAWGIQAIEHIIWLRKEGRVVVSKVTKNGLIRKIKIDNDVIVDYEELAG
jgi:hypothetical protein